MILLDNFCLLCIIDKAYYTHTHTHTQGERESNHLMYNRISYYYHNNITNINWSHLELSLTVFLFSSPISNNFLLCKLRNELVFFKKAQPPPPL